MKLLKWLARPSPTDWLMACFTAVLLWIAYRQIVLTRESNSINKFAAAAAKSAADAAQKSVQLTEAGEETTKKTADAIKATADANKSTATATKDAANATKTVAEENAKTAKATEQVAAIAARALKVSLDATAIAQRAAEAAEKAANASVDSNTIASDTAKKQLRAYVTVIMSPRPLFVLAQNGRTFEMRPRLRNSGQTPAKDIVVRAEAYFRRDEKVDPRILPALNGAGMTIGPGGEWPLFLQHVMRQGEPNRQNGGKASVLGRVEYVDVFGEKRFTNFFFFEGPGATDGRAGFEPIYADSWNDSN